MVDFNYILKLERNSSVDADWIRLLYINDNWNEFTELEYYGIIDKLKQNELDPIASGLNYGTRDIQKKLNKLK